MCIENIEHIGHIGGIDAFLIFMSFWAGTSEKADSDGHGEAKDVSFSRN